MNAILKTYLLHFTAPLHISDARLDYGSSAKMIHSDSIYAAVISALARTGKLPDDVERSGDLGCTISSLFPFTTANGEIIYFFPRPFIQVKSEVVTPVLVKKMKKVKWIDKSFFEAVINAEDKDIGDEERNLISGEFLSEFNLKGNNVIFTQVIPRAKIPRSRLENEGETTIFYMERVLFTEDSGLYLIAEGDTTMLEQGLQILQHEGIGTDRNVGQGTFTLEKDVSMALKIPDISQFVTTMGLLCPDQKEVGALTGSGHDSSESNARWDLIHRGGWLTTEGYNGIRKKSVYMFTEGSVFHTATNGLQAVGKVNCDIKPDPLEGLQLPAHPVWRCGRTLAIPVLI